jgi:hypothetical protein
MEDKDNVWKCGHEGAGRFGDGGAADGRVPLLMVSDAPGA